ncbi:MAG: ACP S-malonyltransferase [Nitratireductor sp.]|nr:ACP S-malonyltransferase [Nitratireductor sp.]
MRTFWLFPGLEALFQASRTRRWLDDPVVADTLAEVSAILSGLTGEAEDLGRFLSENARPHLADMDRMFVAHTGIQAGIARSLGRRETPDGYVGCSVGDLARIAVSGVLPLSETIDLVWFCTRQRKQCPPGIMSNVRPAEGRFSAAQLAFAANAGISFSHWSDRHAAVSGSGEAVAAFAEAAKAHGLKTRQLYAYPFHSTAMLPLAHQMAANTGRWHPSPPCLPVYSTVELAFIQSVEETVSEALAGACRPVRWKQALDDLAHHHGMTRLVNIGPSDTLTGWIADNADYRDLEVLEAWDLCDPPDPADRTSGEADEPARKTA